MARNLKSIKFKDYEWPHNPEFFNMDFTKRIVEHEYPDIHGSDSEDLGNKARIVSGSGVFYGKDAFRQFSKLVLLFADKTPGTFIHPIWSPFEARFSKLSCKEEPTPFYVSYDFEFIEYKEIKTIVRTNSAKKDSGNNNANKNKPAASKEYIVKSGDTLWDISKKYYGKGSDWPKIANANKKLIKNPNLIHIGWKIIIP